MTLICRAAIPCRCFVAAPDALFFAYESVPSYKRRGVKSSLGLVDGTWQGQQEIVDGCVCFTERMAGRRGESDLPISVRYWAISAGQQVSSSIPFFQAPTASSVKLEQRRPEETKRRAAHRPWPAHS